VCSSVPEFFLSFDSIKLTGNAPEIKLESQNISVAFTQVNLMLSKERKNSGTDEHTGFLAGDRGNNPSPASQLTLSKKSEIPIQQIGNPRNAKLKANFLTRKSSFEPQYLSTKKESGETITTPRLEMSMEREISENVYVAGEGRFEKQYAKGYLGVRYKVTLFNDMLFLTGGVYAGVETNPKPMTVKASLQLETPRHLMVKGEVETGGSGLWYRFKGMAKTGPLLPVDWGFYAEKDKGVGPFVQVHLEKLLKFDLNVFGTKTFGKDNMLLFGVSHTFN
jgi:hypothetical protein